MPGEAPFCPFSTSNSNSPSLSSSCSSSSPSSSVCPLGSSGIGEKTVSCSPAGEVCVEVLNTDSIYQLTQETYTYQKAIYLVKSFEASAPFFFFLPDKDKVQHNSLSCSVGEMTSSLSLLLLVSLSLPRQYKDQVPKQPLSAYMLFTKSKGPKLKAKHPELSQTEMAVKLGERKCDEAKFFTPPPPSNSLSTPTHMHPFL